MEKTGQKKRGKQTHRKKSRVNIVDRGDTDRGQGENKSVPYLPGECGTPRVKTTSVKKWGSRADKVVPEWV